MHKWYFSALYINFGLHLTCKIGTVKHLCVCMYGGPLKVLWPAWVWPQTQTSVKFLENRCYDDVSFLQSSNEGWVCSGRALNVTNSCLLERQNRLWEGRRTTWENNRGLSCRHKDTTAMFLLPACLSGLEQFSFQTGHIPAPTVSLCCALFSAHVWNTRCVQ